MIKKTFLKTLIMNRKTFLESGDRLYFIKGRQLFSITESKTTTLFLYLEIKWKEIEKQYKEINKDKKAGDNNIPVVVQFDYKTYKILAGDLTKDMYMPIGFGVNDVKVVFIEKETMKAIQEYENKKNI